MQGRNFRGFCDLTEGAKITTANLQYNIAQYLSLIATSRKYEPRILGQGAFHEIFDRENFPLYSILIHTYMHACMHINVCMYVCMHVY